MDRSRLLSYIPALDGLRAIAIITVVLFHVDKTLLPGGFIGVDVFFVISGYIISRNIFIKIDNQKFSLLDFYKRRFVRIIPAIFVTVFLSLLCVIFIYSSERLEISALSGFFSLISVSNIFFWLNSGYFDPVSQNNIFLHTWSLGVEEQFYLTWPLLLMVICRSKHRILILLTICLVSLAFSFWLSSVSPAATFFLMPARVFQFAFGAYVAVLHIRLGSIQEAALRCGNVVSSLSFAVGIGVIFIVSALASGERYEFLFAALLPTLAASVAILFVEAPFARKTLGSLPFTIVGQRAYSIYLVHWPVIVIAGYYLGAKKPLLTNLLIVVSCLVLAELLYRGVESPLRIRSGKNVKANLIRLGTTGIGLVVTAAFSIGVWAIVTNSEMGRTPATSTAEKEIASGTSVNSFGYYHKDAQVTIDAFQPYARQLFGIRNALGRTHRGCQIGVKETLSDFNKPECVSDSNGREKVFVIADSYGAETIIILEEVFSSDDIVSASGAGCLPIFPEPGTANRSLGCQELNIARYEWLRKRNDLKVVALSSNWRHWRLAQIETTIEYILSLNKKIILLGARPQFTESVPVLLDGPLSGDRMASLDRYLSYDLEKRDTEIRAIVEKFGGDVKYVDLLDALCPDECRAFTKEGDLIYLDGAHMTATVAQSIGRALLIQNSLFNLN